LQHRPNRVRGKFPSFSPYCPASGSAPWKAYNELAWTEDWLADPASYEHEGERYISLILRYCTFFPETMLHLGSGAGGLDRIFKRHFSVTGVDVSPGMLAKARATHPEIEYIEADMRSLRLEQQFDVVAIPDSIDYMVCLEDLRKAMATAVEHVKPGGVVLITGKTAETFQNNNFAYTGDKDGIHVTLLENNHVPSQRPNTYEATFVYLIRRNGQLTMHTDQHVLGLFPQTRWEEAFQKHGLILHQSTLDGLYDPYLLGEGEYPMQVFLGVKNRT